MPFEGPILRSGELRIGVGACTISASSDGPLQFQERVPAEEWVLWWGPLNNRWIPTTAAEWGFSNWADAARLNPTMWWHPMPPPPPNI